MRILLDTNVLTRIAHRKEPEYGKAVDSVNYHAEVSRPRYETEQREHQRFTPAATPLCAK